jgi:exopolysaccharide production protein ExoZ
MMLEEIRSRSPMLEGIQYLRGIAALMVVFHHARLEFGGAASVVVGARGVEIFFVISGLVMMHSTRRDFVVVAHGIRGRLVGAWTFCKRRFVRVAPLYWMALVAWTVIAGASFADFLLLMDGLFIPHWNVRHPEMLAPALIPGWSLNYEMFFYALFGLSLLLRRKGIWLTCACIAILTVCGEVLRPATAAGIFYTNSIMLNFVAGMLLYFPVVALRGKATARQSRGGLALALMAGFASLGVSPHWAGAFWLPCACSVIVLCMLLLFDGVHLVIPALLGDASYSIYLFHPMLFLLVRQIIRVSGLSPSDTPGVLATFAVYLTVTAALGVLIHRVVEKPLTRRIAARM